MGKAKAVEPEPADKIIRTLGENLCIEVSEEEKKYRNKKGPDDVKHIRKEKLKCTVCGKSLADLAKKATAPYVHMVLGVLVCRDCSSFYGDGYFSVDEDGDDKYCRWCGQGGTLYLCSGCTCAFCKKCMKQNLDKQDLKDLESDDWKCFICKPKPLFECRTVCWFLQENATKAKNEKDEENDKEKTPPTRSRRERGNRKSIKEENTTPASRKRKASEVEDESETEKERGSKRRKSSDSGKESKQQTTSSNRRSRSQSVKEKEDKKESEDESLKKPSTVEPRSKRTRGSKPEVESSPIKKSPRVSKINEDQSKKKTEENTISDDENEEKDDSIEEVPKKGANKSLRKDSSPAMAKTTTSQEKVEKRVRSKRLISEKNVKEPTNVDPPSKRPSRSLGKKTSLSEKNVKSKKAEVDNEIESPKRNQRTTKRNRLNKDEDEDEEGIKMSDSDVHLISLDGNSESETESKGKPTKRKAVSKYSSPMKSKLNLSKNADSKVVQASGYVNSALKDIKELSILISNRCEKLCTKSIQSSDDVISVCNKLQQLMTGVHRNLGLIEKGLNTKISNWQEEKLEDKNISEENVSEVKSVDNQEHTEGSSTLKGEQINDEEDSSIDKSPDDIEELKITEGSSSLQMGNSENPEEEMEVDENNEERMTDQVENEKEQNLNEKTDSELDNKNDEKEHIEEPVENISDTSEKTNSEDKESDTEKDDKQIEITEENDENEISSPEKVEDVKDSSKEDEDTEESITYNKNESVDKFEEEETVEETENKPENSENTTENSNESQNNKLDVIEEKNEIREKEKENVTNETAFPSCDSESLDVYNSESVDSVSRQSSAIVVSKSQDNGVGDTKKSSDEGVLGDVFSEERTNDKKKEENVSPEVMDVETGENESTTGSDKPAILEDNTHNTPTSSQSEERGESEELKNGTADDEKVDTEKKEDKSKEIESTEQRSTEKREENRIRTPSDEHKSSGSPHTDPSRRLSGDRDRERERGGGGRYSQEQRWSGDRGGSWNRDRDRYQDRGWSGRGGSWNRYEDRRPNRGGWGWNR
uniref:PHD-type domain-containing protein n=1 Tax=Homalodisca liturata TaxID=320908 RepID=A0A1B6ICZ2_9HEMI